MSRWQSSMTKSTLKEPVQTYSPCIGWAVPVNCKEMPPKPKIKAVHSQHTFSSISSQSQAPIPYHRESELAPLRPNTQFEHSSTSPKPSVYLCRGPLALRSPSRRKSSKLSPPPSSSPLPLALSPMPPSASQPQFPPPLSPPLTATNTLQSPRMAWPTPPALSRPQTDDLDRSMKTHAFPPDSGSIWLPHQHRRAFQSKSAWKHGFRRKMPSGCDSPVDQNDGRSLSWQTLSQSRSLCECEASFPDGERKVTTWQAKKSGREKDGPAVGNRGLQPLISLFL